MKLDVIKKESFGKGKPKFKFSDDFCKIVKEELLLQQKIIDEIYYKNVINKQYVYSFSNNILNRIKKR